MRYKQTCVPNCVMLNGLHAYNGILTLLFNCNQVQDMCVKFWTIVILWLPSVYEEFIA